MGMSSETKSRPVALRSAAARRIEEREARGAAPEELGGGRLSVLYVSFNGCLVYNLYGRFHGHSHFA